VKEKSVSRNLVGKRHEAGTAQELPGMRKSRDFRPKLLFKSKRSRLDQRKKKSGLVKTKKKGGASRFYVTKAKNRMLEG